MLVANAVERTCISSVVYYYHRSSKTFHFAHEHFKSPLLYTSTISEE